MAEQRLSGELAIVTGSDSGIGQATAIAFAREGADVIVTYLHDRKGAERTAGEIEGAGRKAAAFQLDQRDSKNVQRFFQEVKSTMGVPTVLVNNAGIDALGKPVKDMTDADWDDVIRTNLSGPFYCCREFIRGIDGTGRHGTIINITSVHQEIPRAGASGYDASKGGLRNLTTTLALELAEKNINVNNIAPGMVLTPMNQSAVEDPEVLKRQVQSIPMKRAAKPEEIAHVAVFLASEQARYIHGATIFVDGALMLFQGQGA
ncbi:SDR family NAD(P)-dependent oxidoreductase [Noviherbaspirillum saxi]|uniref:Glucose 1-dehydrogenase n=1 Tax=Noviherbaspirillum saxi TaxID=2320863 RepID=A0A3A3FJI9_9BURK|nr:glucose 1-dehydrogenase [Noviherbaspirillum saxi]RJF95663.1 glucose 1-dehydrogenase [Noviherbaspirillum saxi]